MTNLKSQPKRQPRSHGQRFQSLPKDQLKSVQLHVRLNADDAQTIRNAAAASCLEVSEYMRRCALGRATKPRWEQKIVLQLSEVVRELRKLHAGYIELGIEPPTAAWQPLIVEAMDAMLRIEK